LGQDTVQHADVAADLQAAIRYPADDELAGE